MEAARPRSESQSSLKPNHRNRCHIYQVSKRKDIADAVGGRKFTNAPPKQPIIVSPEALVIQTLKLEQTREPTWPVASAWDDCQGGSVVCGLRAVKASFLISQSIRAERSTRTETSPISINIT